MEVIPKICRSRIFGKDEHTLTVYAPAGGSDAGDVSPRSSIRVGLAARGAYYSFATHVLRSADGQEPLLVLDKPNVISRVQRRENPELPCAYRLPTL